MSELAFLQAVEVFIVSGVRMMSRHGYPEMRVARWATQSYGPTWSRSAMTDFHLGMDARRDEPFDMVSMPVQWMLTGEFASQV